MAGSGEHPPGHTSDQLQPLRVRVDEHELVDREEVAHPGEPVDQLGGVCRTAADDRQPHPLTPVSVTPSTKDFCARKKTTTTGTMTSKVMAIVRFHWTWYRPLKLASPSDTVH